MQYTGLKNSLELEDRPIEELIKEAHNNDAEQLEVIFSNEKRIIVEAPAGCGKTRTMTSKILYLLSKNLVPNPKKILGLTFSVNAAYKMKKEIKTVLSDILGNLVNDRVVITNYHGFCRYVLSKYGYLIDRKLININKLVGFNEDNVKNLVNSFEVNLRDAEFISDIPKFVKDADTQAFKYMDRYLALCSKYILPYGYMPFNAIIMFAIKLFNEYPRLREFYQKLYSYIIVDEFQDTNILGYELLKSLVAGSTSLLIMGDPLQQIYGFIGAIPNIMDRAKEEFKMKKFSFRKNYRFKDNKKLLRLDNIIRENAKNNPKIMKALQIDLIYTNKPEEEYLRIAKLLRKLQEEYPNKKIAILIRQRSKNSDLLLNTLDKEGIPFFYALFLEEDKDYIKFHSDALGKLVKIGNFNKKTAQDFVKRCYDNIKLGDIKIKDSLTKLLEVFIFKGLFGEFNYLNNEEKMELLKDVLDNRSLRHGLEYLDEQIVLATIHSSKGLEWDYVILPDMEQYVFPSWHGLCQHCKNQYSCNKYDGDISKFYEELSVFYVACTRAKKDIFFSASQWRINYKEQVMKSEISCFLRMEGLSFQCSKI